MTPAARGPSSPRFTPYLIAGTAVLGTVGVALGFVLAGWAGAAGALLTTWLLFIVALCTYYRRERSTHRARAARVATAAADPAEPAQPADGR